MTDAREKILIVDDEKMNIVVLESLLKDEYDVQSAHTGKKALELAAATPKPDLILLDIVLPDIDGFEVCKRLKDDEATMGIPIVFISARTDVEDETRGFEIGAVDYISKPFNNHIVNARVKTHLRLKYKTDLLEQLCALDGLLEIPNRRRFDSVIESEWKRTLRLSQPLSLIIADIDYFKEYNDFYGHTRGDDCLKKVAWEMDACCKRSSDLLARYGGEEFAVILPDTPLAGAEKLASEIRECVENLKIVHERSHIHTVLTVSLGAASMVPNEKTTPLDLIRAADAMLYKAKRDGRNRVAG